MSAVSRLLAVLGALTAVLALSACAASQDSQIPYNVTNFGQPDAPKAVVATNSYKLAPQDTVTVSVFQVPDLSHDYAIDLSGNLTMPLIGPVSAMNLSTAELADSIRQKLGARYLQDPNVTVALKESASRVVTVEGSVNSPGVYQATGPLSLAQAIAIAKGTDQYANPRRVAIFRTIGGQRKAAAFDLVSIRRGKADDPAVYAGDVIMVDGSKMKSAQRDILSVIPLLAFATLF